MCSIGNVPLAAVLWNGGISFGVVVAFIFADLIIIPILLIYRKYYGTRMAVFLGGCCYLTMVAAGYVIELVFAPLGLVPGGARHANVGDHGIRWNYTSVLNIVFLLLAAALVVRFLRTGGRAMLAMMGGGPDDTATTPTTPTTPTRPGGDGSPRKYPPGSAGTAGGTPTPMIRELAARSYRGPAGLGGGWRMAP